MNIFYFNVNYTCNSNCIFCYSHNTIHSGRIYNEIAPDDFIKYLKLNNIKKNDRVIINGGEPFLHSKILILLKSLLEIQCEVLIYTNGRCLNGIDFGFMTDKYRFVIPVHGHKTLHDKISRCKGSFEEMVNGIKHLRLYKCKIDIKVILNPIMISSKTDFYKTLQEIDSLPFNNAVHITKMADTIISQKNGLTSVNNELAAKYTRLLYNHFVNRMCIIKIFDTCVRDIKVTNYDNNDIPIKVFFKDIKTSWLFTFNTPHNDCRNNCPSKEYCQSAVGNYTVLEYNNGKFYKGIE